MSDPLSIAAGIAGLISLGIQVTGSLVKFYTLYKGQDTDVARTIDKLGNLLDTFRFLHDALQNRTFRPDEQDLIKNIESSIQKCDELIQEMQDEYEKFDKASISSIRGTIKVAGRRAAYPFRQSTLKKLDEDISEIRDNLSLALDVLQLRDHRNTQGDISELKLLLELVRASQISSTIRDWLKAPDVIFDHNATCAKRHPGTGMWFVKGPIFTKWVIRESSFLWLNGFAGCGKSVLCSTAIQYVFRHKRADPGVGIACFYFTFNEESKQDESAMLRALLLQLSGQLSDGQADLARLHASYHTGTPPAAVLTECLRHLIQKFHQVYILLDALDESPRYSRRDQVLNAVETMRKWSLPGVHLLVTSRDEPDIRESLKPARDEEVIMKNADIDQDISNFISGRLSTDPELRKWRAYHDRIQQALAERAQGVFRWADCQFESLRSCPRSEYHLDECLRSLPENLDKTYERMLCRISKGSVKEARRILTLLCFSSRPLTVAELIDGIAIDLNEPAGLDCRRRLQDADDLRVICPGLIDVGLDGDNEESDEKRMTPTVRIAHFSVQEYLESDRIRQQKAAIFALQSASAHREIAQLCLVYLLEPRLSSGQLNEAKLEEFPLARSAAKFWYHHYKNAAGATSALEGLILRMFNQQQDSFYTWVKLHNVESTWTTQVNFQLASSDIASPVYYASFLGLDGVLHELIAVGQGNSSEKQDLINAKGGKYGNALQAASGEGHEKVVQILLDAGAEVNAQGGEYGNALQAASALGHAKIVWMLLDARAKVNAQGGYYANALQAASVRGLGEVVQMLLEAGAHVNAQGGVDGTALQAASAGGHEKIVQMLLAAGANVNAEDGRSRTALYAASYGGHEKIVQMLLDAGADIDALGGRHGNALQAASYWGYEKVVQMLLNARVNVNARGGEEGTALQAASLKGRENIVQKLLGAGADVDAQGGRHGNALRAASAGGHEKVVQMLLEAGAHVNAQGGVDGTALQAASAGGHEKIVQMLLAAGANVNAEDGRSRTALYAASYGGHEKIVQMLLDAGANVHALGEADGTALYAASLKGHENIVQKLLEASARVNDQAGVNGTALYAASDEGHERIVRMLLDAKAEINAQGGRHGNALQAASYWGNEKIVQMLLDAGANVHALGKADHTALYAASLKGHENIVQKLLDAGAHANAQGGGYGTALQASSYLGHEKIVQKLLDAGAHVNAQGGEYGAALQAASAGGHEKIVRMLLDAKAEINDQSGQHGNALQAASYRGHEKVVQMLLEAGAHVNAQGGVYGTALQAASYRGREKVVQILLGAGADVNARGGRYGNALQAALAGGHVEVVQILQGADALS